MRITMMTNMVTMSRCRIEPGFEALDYDDGERFRKAFHEWCIAQWEIKEPCQCQEATHLGSLHGGDPRTADPAVFYQRGAE